MNFDHCDRDNLSSKPLRELDSQCYNMLETSGVLETSGNQADMILTTAVCGSFVNRLYEWQKLY